MTTLRHDLHGSKGDSRWFDLYECEHISEDSYPIETAIPVGTHTNFLLCRHCWEGVKGAVLQEVIRGVLRGSEKVEGLDVEALMTILEGEAGPLRSAQLRDFLNSRSYENSGGSLQSEKGRDIVEVDASQNEGRAFFEKPGADQYAHQ